MKPSVIYLFVSPSGRAYAGRRYCDHTDFPRRGAGPLPDGYSGSGKLWQNVVRKHGSAIRWIILRRFPEGTPRAIIDAAERRAIRLARHLWSGRCMNIRAGGQGFTSAEAIAHWSDPHVQAKARATNARPEVKARRCASNKKAQNRPDVKAKVSAGLRESHAKPDVKARRIAANKKAQNRPEVSARKSATMKELTRQPEARAKLSARLKGQPKSDEARRNMSIAAKRRCNRDKARKVLAPFIQPPTWTRQGAAVWAYRPPLRLSLSVFK